MLTFAQFEELFDAAPKCSRFEFSVKDSPDKFIIIKYEEYIAFSSYGLDAKEKYYSSIKELMTKQTFNNTTLIDFWDSIIRIVANNTYNLCDEIEIKLFEKFINDDESVGGDVFDDTYLSMPAEEKKKQLYIEQKKTLDLFLERNAITKAQYDKSLSVLNEKFGA